jgi:serine/threonine-protein kinase
MLGVERDAVGIGYFESTAWKKHARMGSGAHDRGGVMSTTVRIAVLIATLLLAASTSTWADCAADCLAAKHSCSGSPDFCSSYYGVCLNRCGLDAERHGAIAYSTLKGVYGYSYDHGSSKAAADAAVANCRKEDKGAGDCKAVVTFRNACAALALGNNGAWGSAWGLSQREASNKALIECRPHGGTSCKIERQVCSGAR